jgi:hypothetical protein
MERPKERSLFSQSLRGCLKSCGAILLTAAATFPLAWAANQQQKPDGRALMMRMADFLAKSPAWSVTAHTAYDAIQPDGYKVEWNEMRTVTLSRPDRLRVEVERSDGARNLVLFDGKQVTTFDEKGRVYAQESHPGTVDNAVVYFVRDLGMRLPLAVMLLDNMPAELQQRVQAVKYVEKTTTLGAPADHIAAKTPTVDFQLWIAQGDRPLPMRVVLTYKNSPGQPQFRAQFSDWNLDINPQDTLFTFTPPAGARKIPFAASLLNIAPPSKGAAARMKGEKP